MNGLKIKDWDRKVPSQILKSPPIAVPSSAQISLPSNYINKSNHCARDDLDKIDSLDRIVYLVVVVSLIKSGSCFGRQAIRYCSHRASEEGYFSWGRIYKAITAVTLVILDSCQFLICPQIFQTLLSRSYSMLFLVRTIRGRLYIAGYKFDPF